DQRKHPTNSILCLPAPCFKFGKIYWIMSQIRLTGTEGKQLAAQRKVGGMAKRAFFKVHGIACNPT
ncbi:MAG TPA: hypothetical protein VK907_08170, partial [Phnomibacter sp.]|nr:hypothetical protein [Phnomibacter sp.]